MPYFQLKRIAIIICVLGTTAAIIGNDRSEELPGIPDFIKVCHKSDPNLNECVKQSIQNLRPYLENGIPELLVPPIDPLLVPNITIKQQAGAIQLDSVFTNMYFDGGSQYHLRGVRIDPSKDRFRLKIWFPQLYMTSNYDIIGRLLMLPLKGMGVCQGNFTDIDAVASLRGERYMKNNMAHLRVKTLTVQFNIGGASIQLENLFNGDSELGRTVNTFLNENWKSVTAEIRPSIEESISDMLKEIANRLFEAYPINKLLPD